MCNLPGFGGGGATPAELGQNQQTHSLENTLTANYGTTFGEQQNALKMLNTTIQRIQSGQTGPGFGGAELAARTSQIENAAGAQARNVTQAVQDRAAGQVFGGATDTSGLARASAINKEVGEQALSSAETAKSNALTNLTAENYAQGRENANRTAAGLEALSGAYGGAASSSLGGAISTGQQAFSQDEAIRQQELQKGSLLGGLTKLGLSAGLDFATGGMAGLAGTGGESFLQKSGDFLKGGLSSLAG